MKGCVGSRFHPPAMSGRRNVGFTAFRQLLSLGVLSAQCPSSRLFSVFSFLWEGNFVCVGQMKVTVWYNQILGQDNQGPRPQDMQRYVRTAQLNCHLVAVLIARGGRSP